ncbi:MAG: hypothetical protein ACREIH_01835 [Nitrospiraceae bacterium]
MAWKYADGSSGYLVAPFIGMITLCWLLGGCSTLGGSPPSSARSPLKIVVGPVILEAPVSKSTQINSFDEAPPPEVEPVMLAQLMEEVQIKAQRSLTEHLARQGGLVVVPFDETRRMLADLAPTGTPLTDAQLETLGTQSRADVVVTAIIHDYGIVRWQYWVTGWVTHATIATTVVGVATAWNPIAIGAYLAFDATTDFPIWYGGAYAFGWAFRPVRVHLDATQLTHCPGPIWTEEELAIKVPGKTLAQYPPEDRGRKEIQLEANLNRAIEDLAETAGRDLTLQPCTENGKPKTINNFSFLSLLDHLIH